MDVPTGLGVVLAAPLATSEMEKNFQRRRYFPDKNNIE